MKYLMLCFLALVSCTSQEQKLTQVSTIDALLNGLYDGETSLDELKQMGDFGLGTFNALDGELLMVDGQVYQIKSSGKVELPKDEVKTPFAAVHFFEADESYKLKKLRFSEFEQWLKTKMKSENLFYAVRISGKFEVVTTRAVPAQEKPYQPLTQVVVKQPIFDFTQSSGVIAGYQCPPFVKGLNVPGLHLHFVNEEKTGGGHILDFVIDEAIVELDQISRFEMILPQSEKFKKMDLKKDKSAELHKVEKLKTGKASSK